MGPNPLCDLSCLTIDNDRALPGRPQGGKKLSSPHKTWCMVRALQFSGWRCSQGFMLMYTSCIPSLGASVWRPLY